MAGTKLWPNLDTKYKKDRNIIYKYNDKAVQPECSSGKLIVDPGVEGVAEVGGVTLQYQIYVLPVAK